MLDSKALEELSKVVRRHILQMAHEAKSPHIGSSFSCVEALVTLFFNVMKDDDRFIMSKGHGCMAYYAVLAEKGIIPKEWLKTYSKNGGELAEHPHRGIPGVPIGTGSLGHGLSVSVGAALARKLKKNEGREFVLLSDGECNEGTVWEAAMFAAHHKLDNLIAIIDCNQFQATGRCDEVLEMNLKDKFMAFGWNVFRFDGHDIKLLRTALKGASSGRSQTFRMPSVLLLNTVKGKGVSFMENDLEWHYRFPNEEELQKALKELEDAKRVL